MEKTQEYLTKFLMLLLAIAIIIGIGKGFISAFESLPERIARFTLTIN